MKVTVTQTGGVLGFPRRVQLDSDALSGSDALELARRARAVEPATAPPRSYPGELGYSVRVEGGDHPPVEAGYVDSSMPDQVRDLVAWVEDHPKQVRPGPRE
jgi:hypothetical protein